MTLDPGEQQGCDLVPSTMGGSPWGAAAGEGEDQGSLGMGIQEVSLRVGTLMRSTLPSMATGVKQSQTPRGELDFSGLLKKR